MGLKILFGAFLMVRICVNLHMHNVRLRNDFFLMNIENCSFVSGNIQTSIDHKLQSNK